MDLFHQKSNKPQVIKYPLTGDDLWFVPFFVSEKLAAHWYQSLLKCIDWKEEEIKLFGKTHKVPRLVAWHGDANATYAYSGLAHQPEPWNPILSEIKEAIEAFVSPTFFNSVLLNYYRGGLDKMGWHADDERELGNQPTIASLSLGVTRRFDIKSKKDATQKLQIQLNTGSLLVMRTNFQERFKHQIPLQKKINKGRINLTFRQIL